MSTAAAAPPERPPRNSATPPTLSVVLPTRNRAQSLRRTLAALGRQSCGTDRFEVVVVANDCSDGTGAMVRQLSAPYLLRLVESTEAGMSRARNTGASLACGNLLVFIDDDIEPVPGWLAAHVEAQRSFRNLLTVGPLLPPPVGRVPGLLGERLHRLDAAFTHTLATADRPLDWQCMMGGNFSVSKALFEAAGGFDTSIVGYGTEDYEFGYRAQKAGGRFTFAPAAIAYHHRQRDLSLAAYLRNARTLGRNDALAARRHPDMFARLDLARLGRSQTALGRLGRACAFDHQRLGDAATTGLLLLGAALACCRRRRQWNRLSDCLHQYWYLRGVADAIGNGTAIAAYLAELGAVPAGKTGSVSGGPLADIGAGRPAR